MQKRKPTALMLLGDILRATAMWAAGGITILVVIATIGLATHDPLWLVTMLDIPKEDTVFANTITIVIVVSFAFCFYGSVVYNQIGSILSKMERYQEQMSKGTSFARMEIVENNRFLGIKCIPDTDGNLQPMPYYGSHVMYQMTNTGKVFPRVISSKFGLQEDNDYENYIYSLEERIDLDKARQYVHNLVFGEYSKSSADAAYYVLSIWQKLPLLDMTEEAQRYLNSLTK